MSVFLDALRKLASGESRVDQLAGLIDQDLEGKTLRWRICLGDEVAKRTVWAALYHGAYGRTLRSQAKRRDAEDIASAAVNNCFSYTLNRMWIDPQITWSGFMRQWFSNMPFCIKEEIVGVRKLDGPITAAGNGAAIARANIKPRTIDVGAYLKDLTKALKRLQAAKMQKPALVVRNVITLSNEARNRNLQLFDDSIQKLFDDSIQKILDKGQEEGRRRKTRIRAVFLFDAIISVLYDQMGKASVLKALETTASNLRTNILPEIRRTLDDMELEPKIGAR